MHQPTRGTVLLIAFSPLLLLGLAILNDDQLRGGNGVPRGTASIAVTSTMPPRHRSPTLHAMSDAHTRRADWPTARGAARARRLGKTAQHCVGHDGAARSFIMVFMGHSGSSAIMSELRAHTRVRVERAELVDHDDLQYNSTAALQHVRAFFARALAAGRVPGFKMRPRHIRADPHGWRQLVREFGTRVVWNYRSNIVKQAVGEYSYKKLGDQAVVEGLRSEAAVRRRCTVGVGCSFRVDDLDFFHYTLRDLMHADNTVAAAVHTVSRGRTVGERRLCVHELPYEDYLYDRVGTMRSLFDFLGLEQQPTRPTRFKATGDNLCAVVQNWDTLCHTFYGCYAWRKMMDDEVNGCTCTEMGNEVKYCRTEL